MCGLIVHPHPSFFTDSLGHIYTTIHTYIWSQWDSIVWSWHDATTCSQLLWFVQNMYCNAASASSCYYQRVIRLCHDDMMLQQCLADSNYCCTWRNHGQGLDIDDRIRTLQHFNLLVARRFEDHHEYRTWHYRLVHGLKAEKFHRRSKSFWCTKDYQGGERPMRAIWRDSAGGSVFISIFV